jgi:hypothetical protein
VWPAAQCSLRSAHFRGTIGVECRHFRFVYLSVSYRHLVYSPGRHHGTFLDVIDCCYLKSLNINAIQPLPIVEFRLFTVSATTGRLFSPETDWYRQRHSAIANYLDRINGSCPIAHVAYTLQDIAGANQFRMMVDMCHLYHRGIAGCGL